MQWAEEHIRKDVCGLNSKLVSTIHTQIEFILCAAKVEQALRPALNLIFCPFNCAELVLTPQHILS